jgi:hypothetical protein
VGRNWRLDTKTGNVMWYLCTCAVPCNDKDINSKSFHTVLNWGTRYNFFTSDYFFRLVIQRSGSQLNVYLRGYHGKLFYF